MSYIVLGFSMALIGAIAVGLFVTRAEALYAPIEVDEEGEWS